MADPRQRMVKGQAVREFPVETWNSMLQATDYVRAETAAGHEDSPDRLTNGTTIWVQNDTSTDLPAYSVLALESPVISPDDDNPFGAAELASLFGRTPAGSEPTFAITREPIGKDMLGRARIAGETWVRVEVVLPGHHFATPIVGQTNRLISAEFGGARILWIPAGVGLKWALVRLCDLLPPEPPVRIACFENYLREETSTDGGVTWYGTSRPIGCVPCGCPDDSCPCCSDGLQPDSYCLTFPSWVCGQCPLLANGITVTKVNDGGECHSYLGSIACQDTFGRTNEVVAELRCMRDIAGNSFLQADIEYVSHGIGGGIIPLGRWINSDVPLDCMSPITLSWYDPDGVWGGGDDTIGCPGTDLTTCVATPGECVPSGSGNPCPISRAPLGTASTGGALDTGLTIPSVVLPDNCVLQVVVSAAKASTHDYTPTVTWGGVTLSMVKKTPTASTGKRYVNARLYSAAITTGGTHDIVLDNGSDVAAWTMQAAEVLCIGALVDQSSAAIGTAGASPDSGTTGSTSSANEYAQGFAIIIRSGGQTWDNGFSNGGQDLSYTFAGETITVSEGYKVLSAIGTVDAAIVEASGAAWAMGVATFP